MTNEKPVCWTLKELYILWVRAGIVSTQFSTWTWLSQLAANSVNNDNSAKRANDVNLGAELEAGCFAFALLCHCYQCLLLRECSAELPWLASHLNTCIGTHMHARPDCLPQQWTGKFRLQRTQRERDFNFWLGRYYLTISYPDCCMQLLYYTQYNETAL